MEELMYKALMMGRNKKIADEEFLVATGQKEEARFSVAEDEILFSDVFKDERGCIHVRPENDGYLEICIACSDSFIRVDKSSVTTDSLKENDAKVGFTVLAKELHNGKNFARIVLKTSVQRIEIPVTVNNRIAIMISENSPKKAMLKLEREYLDFRMGNTSLEVWRARSFNIIGSVNGNAPEDFFLMLYKAHVNVICRDTDDPENIIEYISSELSSRQDYSAELFAYFLYVKSLYERQADLTTAALDSVRLLYEKEHSWPLLWIMFYLDEEYADDPGRKLSEIRALFLEGKCISPVMYFEAFDVLRNNPDLTIGDMDFLIQVLRFAARNGISETGPVLALSDMLFGASKEELSEINISLALSVLKEAFDKCPVSSLCNTIAKLLILDKNKDRENHIYFERAVFDLADIPLLYNYYISTLDENEMPLIPERVLSYFSGDPATLFENRQYFFANVITNRYENYAYKTTYEKIKESITAYAYDMAVKGKNGRLLSVIYGHVLSDGPDDADIKRVLYRVSFVKEVVCKNTDMAGVLVFHKEFSTYTENTLENGRANVSIFTDDHLILFKDRAGNIYKNVEYELISYEDEKEYAGLCIKEVPVCAFMLTGASLPVAKESKRPDEIILFLLKEFKKQEFTKEYENALLLNLLAAYRNEPVTDETYEMLTRFLKEDISPQARGQLIGLMIGKSRYDEAADEIRGNGFSEVPDEALRELTHVLVQLEKEDEDLLFELSGECLKRGCADTEILRYMCRKYEGPLDMLLLLYEKSTQAGIYDLPVAERILLESAKENKEPDILPEVLARCYEESENRELTDSFLEYCADKYLYGHEQKDLGFFEYFGLELLKNVSFSDSSRAAYLIYMSYKKNIPQRLLKVIQNILGELTARQIMFEEFKAYKDRFSLPGTLANTYIVKYITASKEAPKIEYSISSGQIDIKKKVPMDMVFDGIYVKYFTLLFGESLTWSIEDKKKTSIGFSEIETSDDGSRFAMANEISRLSFRENEAALRDVLKEYYIKDELIKRLF